MADTQKSRRKKEAQARPSFENALGRLEEIVARLETGDIPLEEAIALAEEGRKLSELCEKQLTQAEGKIEQLVERMGAIGTEPLEAAPEKAEDEEA